MNWLIPSFILPIFSSVFAIGSKTLLKYTHPTSYTAYVLLCSAVIVILYNIVSGIKITFSKWSIISGFTFGLALFGFEIATKMASNPGLVNAVYKSQSILTGLASVWFFNSSLSMMSIIGICIAFGSLLITVYETEVNMKKTHSKHYHHIEPMTNKKNKDEKKKEEKEEKEKNKKDWIPIVLFSGILLTLKDLTAVKSIKDGMSPSSYVVSQFSVGAILLLAYKYFKFGTIEIFVNPEDKRPHALSGIAAISIDNVAWCILLVHLMTIAPNPAYPKIISLISVVITSFFSKYFFDGAELDKIQWFGILGILAGISIMTLGS